MSMIERTHGVINDSSSWAGTRKRRRGVSVAPWSVGWATWPNFRRRRATNSDKAGRFNSAPVPASTTIATCSKAIPSGRRLVPTARRAQVSYQGWAGHDPIRCCIRATLCSCWALWCPHGRAILPKDAPLYQGHQLLEVGLGRPTSTSLHRAPAHHRCGIAILQQCENALSEFGCVPGLHQEPGHAMFDVLPGPLGVRDDSRFAERHGVQEGLLAAGVEQPALKRHHTKPTTSERLEELFVRVPPNIDIGRDIESPKQLRPRARDPDLDGKAACRRNEGRIVTSKVASAEHVAPVPGLQCDAIQSVMVRDEEDAIRGQAERTSVRLYLAFRPHDIGVHSSRFETKLPPFQLPLQPSTWHIPETIDPHTRCSAKRHERSNHAVQGIGPVPTTQHDAIVLPRLAVQAERVTDEGPNTAPRRRPERGDSPPRIAVTMAGRVGQEAHLAPGAPRYARDVELISEDIVVARLGAHARRSATPIGCPLIRVEAIGIAGGDVGDVRVIRDQHAVLPPA